MSKKKFYLFFGLIVFLSIVPLFGLPRAPKAFYIAVEEIDGKTKPSFFGRAADTFYYGDAVIIVEEKGSWVKVEGQSTGKTGWVKDSVVTSRKIVAKNKVSVDASEIALAGKGFSSPLEAKYSESYGIDFDVVDKVEKNSVSPDEVGAFIIEGQLRGEE